MGKLPLRTSSASWTPSTSISLSMELERNRQVPFLDVLVKWHLHNLVGYAISRKSFRTDKYLQAASHNPPAHKLSTIVTLMDGANSVTWLAGAQNYSLLHSFSEPVATPCRIVAQHPNSGPPREVPRNDRAHLPYIQGTSDRSPGYWRSTSFTQYRNYSTKWHPDSDSPKTDNSWLKNEVLTRPIVFLIRCTLAK